MSNPTHERNRRKWNATADHWREMRDEDGLWKRIPSEPEHGFDGGALELIEHHYPAMDGVDTCVIGSGDNYAAFALAGLGAAVTSVDISEEQLNVARAQQLELSMSFVRADAADLSDLPDASFVLRLTIDSRPDYAIRILTHQELTTGDKGDELSGRSDADRALFIFPHAREIGSRTAKIARFDRLGSRRGQARSQRA